MLYRTLTLDMDPEIVVSAGRSLFSEHFTELHSMLQMS